MSRPIPRLRRRPDFLRVARGCRKWAAPGLVLQAHRRAPGAGPTPARDAAGIRVGFTATKKLGNAVARNRVRRRLRAAAERVMPAHAKGGYDYVVIGRAQTLTRGFDALMGDLETALRRVGACIDDGGARTRRNRGTRRA